MVPVCNCAMFKVELTQNDFIGTLENIEGLECQKMKPNHINAIAAWSLMVHRVPQMENWKKKFIKGNLQLNVIPRYQAAYIQMMVLHHVGWTHFNPWLTAKILHEMTFLSKEPIYVKQSKILMLKEKKWNIR